MNYFQKPKTGPYQINGRVYSEIPLSSAFDKIFERLMILNDFTESANSILNEEEKEKNIIPIDAKKLITQNQELF
jgi:hypothetical protein